MGKTCCVKWCKNESYGGCGISFFSFPSNESLKQRWLDVVPLKNKLSKNSVVCSLHFKPDFKYTHMVKTTLRPDAIPSIFPVKQMQPQLYHDNYFKSIAVAYEKRNSKPAPDKSMEPKTGRNEEVSKNLESDKQEFDPDKIKIEPSFDTFMELTKGHQEEVVKSLKSDKQAFSDSEKIKIEPCMEPPLTKSRQDEVIKRLTLDKEALQYKVKLLSQRLKRRNVRIKKLRSDLNNIRKKHQHFEEVESVPINFSKTNKYILTQKNVRTKRINQKKNCKLKQ